MEGTGGIKGTASGGVAVAICTRGRPRMLAAALASLSQLEPCGRDVVFIVVHNDPEMVAPPALDASLSTKPGFTPLQVIEPEPGIAQARNRALEEALLLEARWLAFIDDDEVADRHWLSALVAKAVESRLALTGGPVRMQPPPADATTEEKIVWNGVSQRFAGTERRSARKAAAGRDGGITIVTNNWLCDLDFAREHGLRFDRATALAGGEDGDFYRQVVSRGGRTGWAPEAIVYEEWPRERLTLAYHRRRGHDQAAGRFGRKRGEQGALVLPEAVATVTLRGVAAAFWRARSLFDGGASRVRAARSLGAAEGIIAALRGKSSSHYERITGD